jgi:arylsulfatase A-like enzyme
MEKHANETTVDFIKCGLGHFVDLLDKLRTLGIYDETMIVLSSDHGDYWIDNSVKVDKLKKRGIRVGVTTRASATLAIKPFNARGAVTQTDAPVSLRDIPETILAANGLGQKTNTSVVFEPRDAFTVSATENREREYLHYVWEHKYWAEEVLPPITTYKINGRINDPQSWPDLESTVRSEQQ